MLTKPAGVFLQLLAVPVIIGGCLEATRPDASTWWGWGIFAVGLVLLWFGGRPAARRSSGES
jgi:hypothetical protein